VNRSRQRVAHAADSSRRSFILALGLQVQDWPGPPVEGVLDPPDFGGVDTAEVGALSQPVPEQPLGRCLYSSSGQGLDGVRFRWPCPRLDPPVGGSVSPGMGRAGWAGQGGQRSPPPRSSSGNVTSPLSCLPVQHEDVDRYPWSSQIEQRRPAGRRCWPGRNGGPPAGFGRSRLRSWGCCGIRRPTLPVRGVIDGLTGPTVGIHAPGHANGANVVWLDHPIRWR